MPTSWLKLTQEQLRYVFYLMAQFDMNKVKTYAFIRFCDITVCNKKQDEWTCYTKVKGNKIRFKLSMYHVYYFTERLNFLEESPEQPVRLDSIADLTAVNVQLHGVPFGDYLKAENLYQIGRAHV